MIYYKLKNLHLYEPCEPGWGLSGGSNTQDIYWNQVHCYHYYYYFALMYPNIRREGHLAYVDLMQRAHDQVMWQARGENWPCISLVTLCAWCHRVQCLALMRTKCPWPFLTLSTFLNIPHTLTVCFHLMMSVFKIKHFPWNQKEGGRKTFHVGWSDHPLS